MTDDFQRLTVVDFDKMQSVTYKSGFFFKQ